MKTNDKFLATYKDLETLLRGQFDDMQTAEASFDTTKGEKLRICRQMRNFMSHNNEPGFLIASEAQIKYLEQCVSEERLKGDIAKKHTKTISAYACTVTDKCIDVATKMIKKKITVMPVFSETKTGRIFGSVSIFDVTTAAFEKKTNKIDSIKINTKEHLFVAPDTKVENIPRDKVVFCTSDGTDKGKVLGVVVL